MELVHARLGGVAALVQVPEYLLSNLGLLLGRGPAKLVEADAKPVVDLCVQRVVLVANLLRGKTLLDSLRLCRGAVLVCPAHEEDVVATEAGKPRIDVGRQDTAYDVAEVRHVVDVGQGRRDHDVSFTVARNLRSLAR